MTAAEKLAVLHAWEAHVKAISAVYEADRIACGALIESPRWEAVYGLLSAYTMMVAQAIAPVVEVKSYILDFFSVNVSLTLAHAYV